MVFNSPIWLVGILPWVFIVLRVLPGSAQMHAVSFLSLWKTSTVSSPDRSRKIPPLSTWLVLSALLLSILAASQPTLAIKRASSQPVTIVLDRGVSMALPSAGGKPFRGVIEKCRQQFDSLAADTPVTLVISPGESIQTTGERWATIASAQQPTVVKTLIDKIVHNELKTNQNPIWVLSDQHIDGSDQRVWQVAPEPAEPCVAITAIGARAVPRAQVMVRVENHSLLGSVKLVVESGGYSAKQDVRLPMRGESTDVFVDLPNLDKTIEAQIDSDPDRNPWARAWLIRQSGVVKIVEQGPLPAGVDRMISVYSKDRPATDNGQPVLVTGQALAENQPGIFVHSVATDQRIQGTLTIQAHPLTMNIRTWPGPLDDSRPPAGFRNIVSSGERALLAVRDSTVRQVWLNADLEPWKNTTDFVLFFANTFAWLAGDGQYTCLTGGQLDKPWPGIYGSVAVNAGPFPLENDIHSNAPARSTTESRSRFSITSGILLSALGCLLIAVLARK